MSTIKSVTLTKAMREDILHSVIKRWKETNKEPDKKEASHKFAVWLWGDYYKKVKDKFDGVPKKFLNLRADLKFCVDGEVDQVSFKKGDEMPCDWAAYYGPILKTITSSHKEYSKYKSVVGKWDVWLGSGREVEMETKAILDSVNTTRQLLDLWPQCEPFLPAHIADPDKAIRLPAIQVSRLNERIGVTV